MYITFHGCSSPSKKMYNQLPSRMTWMVGNHDLKNESHSLHFAEECEGAQQLSSSDSQFYIF